MLATNRDPRRAAGIYRRRWQIECLFADTKTRGLNLEDTRLRNPKKLFLLVAVVALAIACVHLASRKVPGRTEYQRGILFREDGALKVKTTGQQGSGVLRSMSEANCFIVLEHERGRVQAGEPVRVQPFEGLV